MYWGRLHPKIVLVGDRTVALPACMGDPARQIEIEEINENFENINYEIIRNLIGYRITFVLTFEALTTGQMEDILDICNHDGDIKIQPWSDENKFYDVIRIDPELAMDYFEDRATLKFMTKDVVSEFFRPSYIRLPKINRFGGIYG